MKGDGSSPLEIALARLSLSELWKRQAWPGEPAKSCRVPYRPEDSRESGSVFVGADGRERFRDFKTGETVDAPGLLALVAGVDNREACRRFIELAGVTREDVPRGPRGRRLGRAPLVPMARASAAVEVIPEKKPELPALREPTGGEIDAIAELRGLHPAGVELAAMAGLLFVTRWKGESVWAVSDASRWNAQFRKFDGSPFSLRGGRTVKTIGVPGGRAAWPLGLPEAGRVNRVLLVEGVPDLLAAFHFIYLEGSDGEASAVSMTGASLWIPGDALALFAGKVVRIVPHVGDTSGAGEAAGLRWQTQLEAAGVRARCFDLSGLVTVEGAAVSDLNDAARLAEPCRDELGAVSIF